MNILFVHEIDWMRKIVFEIHTLSELLSLRGHNIYAIDYESMWVNENMFDMGTLRTKEVNVSRAYPEASVRLVRPGFVKLSVLSRFSAFFTHYFAIQKTIIEKKIDIIVLYSVPTNGLQVIRLAKKLGIPVIFRSIDNLHQLVSNPVLSRITYFFERIVYSRVDLILTVNPKLSEYVIKLGASKDKVRLLPLGVDTNLFHPDIDTTELCQKWGLNGKDKVIVFVGTLPKFSGLDRFISGFRYMLFPKRRVKLLIVGDGEQRYDLECLINAYDLHDRVTITGFQPHESIPEYINMADVCINTFPVSGATKDAYPTKVMQYMACGKPVVSTPLLGLKAMISGEEQGIVYTTSTVENEVLTLLKSDERRQRIGQAALDYVKQTHSYDSIVQQLETILYEYNSDKS